MDTFLVGVIVAGTLLLLVRHGVRALRRKEPACCGCASCTQPEAVRSQCGNPLVPVAPGCDPPGRSGHG